jgi:hypothetical protein
LELLLALEWGQDLVLELAWVQEVELVLMSEFVWGVQVVVSKRVCAVDFSVSIFCWSKPLCSGLNGNLNTRLDVFDISLSDVIVFFTS